eukprot:jgi/Mesen1/604/ME000108S10762
MKMEGVKVKAERKAKVETDVHHTKVSRGGSSKDVKDVKVKTTTTTKVVVAKKERKTYDLPGQKHDPLEERDPLRIFYESLYEQRPDSPMAQIWMMEYGLLPEDEAQRVLKMKLQQKGGSAMRPPPPSRVTTPGRGAANGVKKEAIRKVDVKKAPVSAKKPAENKQVDKKTVTGNGKAKPETKKKKYAESEEDDESDEEVIPIKRIRR